MNERIKELSLQAHETADAIYAEVGGPDLVWWKEYNEKFAELIVAECSKVNNQFIGRRIGEIDLDLVYKEHFGVKE